ncbi:MAG: minor capsid protein [Oscillospiraceae bacterium]|nr:minor capsid protein [Oscillospiraceae bacterium]
MARQNNAQYWAQRMKNMEEALLDQSYSYVQNLDAQFARAQAEIEKQIAVWYRRFAVNNEITLAEAKRLLNSTELAEFQWSVQEYIKYGQENALDGRWMRQLENASAKVHISRLEAIKLQIQQQAEVLYSNQLDYIDGVARLMYEGSYCGTAFEVQRGLGVGWTMHAINEETITKVLSRPWTADNQTFRDRCWTNKQNLVNSVNTNLTQMIIRGEAPDRAITVISKQFDVSRQKAGRLVMTESAYFASAAQKDCFTALDVERYRIVASLDHETCELCGALDGQVFKMSEYQVGLTAPPFHPWCRCCTCPYFEDMAALGERYARDAETGERFKIPGNMTYEQWRAKQNELHGDGAVEKMRTMSYNESADKAQFSRYTDVLGELAPNSFADFRQLKYSDPDGWAAAKAQYRTLNSYKVDAGDISRTDILQLDNAVITEKRSNFTSAFKNSGNIAGAYLDGDNTTMYYAHSMMSDSLKGYKGSSELALLKDKRRFSYIDVLTDTGTMRSGTWHDTEAKLFEYFADLYETKPFKTITMLSERGMCDSCKGVMEQFQALHPDVTINVVSNKKVEGNVWKYRRRKK